MQEQYEEWDIDVVSPSHASIHVPWFTEHHLLRATVPLTAMSSLCEQQTYTPGFDSVRAISDIAQELERMCDEFADERDRLQHSFKRTNAFALQADLEANWP